MSPRRLRASILLFASLFILFSAALTFAQQRRVPARQQPKPAATPAPTFDNILSEDSYNVYVEVRGAGQLVRTNIFTQLADPAIRLIGGGKEIRSIVKWITAHADDVMTSRVFVAADPGVEGLPEGLVAIEFANTEDATKFAPQLVAYLPEILPPVEVESPPPATPEPAPSPSPDAKPKPTKPGFYVQQFGPLVTVTTTPLNLKKLRPARSKPLAESPHFRTARNRFASENVFLFINMDHIEKEEQRLRKIEEELYEQELKAKQNDSQAATIPEATPLEPNTPEPNVKIAIAEPATEMNAANDVAGALITTLLDRPGIQARWPEGIAVAISIENESIDARAALLNSPGEKSDAIPFLPALIPGPPIVPESPTILPADVEGCIIASLDLQQIYLGAAKPSPPLEFRDSRGRLQALPQTTPDSPIASLERRLKVNFKDEVLPLLGSEVAFVFPLSQLGVGPNTNNAGPPAEPSASPVAAQQRKQSFTLALSVKDKEGMKLLIPKLIEGLGIKGASALAQVERRDDTELVSYAGVFAYAFVGNFVVFSPEVDVVRHTVDQYLKHETLATDPMFKESIRWQPRQLQAQAYLSPVLTKSFETVAAQLEVQMTEFKDQISQLTANPKPVAYSLTTDGQGTFHELHVPKELLSLLLISTAGTSNPPEEVKNERAAKYAMYSMIGMQRAIKEEKGSYGSLEELIESNDYFKEMLAGGKYRFEVIASPDKFEITAVPAEYGKTGKMSFFIDETGILRGADHGGGPATVSDARIF